MIAAGIPGGYYDMGHYLELGYGVKQGERKARIYFRKAADMGSPEAQAYIGKLLEPKDRSPEVARQMRYCAADQGNRDAANELGIDLMTDKLYTDALGAFQTGVASGDPTSAWFLRFGFDTSPSDAMSYIGQPKDHERSRRYGLIWKFLNDREGLNPKVPDIDQIVPLPPAQLPEWDGTFQWQKEQDAAKPPQRPRRSLLSVLRVIRTLTPQQGFL